MAVIVTTIYNYKNSTYWNWWKQIQSTPAARLPTSKSGRRRHRCRALRRERQKQDFQGRRRRRHGVSALRGGDPWIPEDGAEKTGLEGWRRRRWWLRVQARSHLQGAQGSFPIAKVEQLNSWTVEGRNEGECVALCFFVPPHFIMECFEFWDIQTLLSTCVSD